jgi:preprotein translocase subunit SecB
MAEAEAKTPTQSLYIQRIYIKDLSLEIPEAPQVFCEECEPTVHLDLHIKHAPLGNDFFDVIVSITVTATHKEKTVFLVEVQQCGIFHIAGFDPKEQDYILNVHCPSVLFPYARELISNTITRASFPPLHLVPINFEMLYKQKQAEMLKEKKEKGEEVAEVTKKETI